VVGPGWAALQTTTAKVLPGGRQDSDKATHRFTGAGCSAAGSNGPVSRSHLRTYTEGERDPQHGTTRKKHVNLGFWTTRTHGWCGAAWRGADRVAASWLGRRARVGRGHRDGCCRLNPVPLTPPWAIPAPAPCVQRGDRSRLGMHGLSVPTNQLAWPCVPAASPRMAMKLRMVASMLGKL